MATYIEGRTATFAAAAALGANVLVKFSAANTVALCGATESPIGVTRNAVFTAGDLVGVDLLNAEGTIKMKAGGAITAGAKVYAIANGKIDDTDPGSCIKVGVALQAATADNDIIEVLPSLVL